jgi:hypothetical protein
MPTHEEIKRQEAKDAILEKINENRCSYPGCTKDKEIDATIPVVLKLPDGRLRPVKDRVGHASFCVYHGQIAKHLMGYAITKEPEEGETPEGSLMGPFEAVHMIESVFKARKAWEDTHPGELFPELHLQEKQ